MKRIFAYDQNLTWKQALKDKKFLIYSILVLIFLLSMIISISNFLNWVEMRQGVVLPDPFLNLFPPVDITWLTFTVIYAFSAWAIITVAREPQRFMVGVITYSLMIYLRIITMWLLPLEAPKDIIILYDPFMLLLGNNANHTKDLFFSGHTASLFISFLVIRQRWIKGVMLTATITIGICVLLQHVHYTIDVIAAPAFAYAAYRGACFIHNRVFRK